MAPLVRRVHDLTATPEQRSCCAFVCTKRALWWARDPLVMRSTEASLQRAAARRLSDVILSFPNLRSRARFGGHTDAYVERYAKEMS
jgi:hypothetical protein